MNINFNNINFGAKYINDVSIKKYDSAKQSYVPTKASFVEIDRFNLSDRDAMHDLLNDWRDCLFVTPIVSSVEYGFEDMEKVYALTRQSHDFDKLRSEEILGLANMDITKGKIPELSFLQVDPILLDKMEPPIYKNVGTGILNSLKQIYNKAIQVVSLYSVTDFYVKNGFDIIDKNKLRYIWRA